MKVLIREIAGAGYNPENYQIESHVILVCFRDVCYLLLLAVVLQVVDIGNAC